MVKNESKGLPRPAKLTADDEAFADNLKAMREARGLTQAALADLVADFGVPTLEARTVYRIESKQRAVSRSEAVAFARALGTTVEAMSSPINEPGMAAARLASQVTHARENLEESIHDYVESLAWALTIDSSVVLGDDGVDLVAREAQSPAYLWAVEMNGLAPGSNDARLQRVADEWEKQVEAFRDALGIDGTTGVTVLL